MVFYNVEYSKVYLFLCKINYYEYNAKKKLKNCILALHELKNIFCDGRKATTQLQR